jgi:hypothetical protein
MVPALGSASPERSRAVWEVYALNPRSGAIIGLRNNGQTDMPVFNAAASPSGLTTKARTGLAAQLVRRQDHIREFFRAAREP